MKDQKTILGIICGVGAVVVIGLLIVLFGGNKKVTCNLVSDQTKNGYKLESKYVISSNGKEVKTVNIEETITSKDKKTLEKFEKQLKEQYEFNNKTYKGYNFKVSNKGGKVTTSVTIDYSKFDMEKFIKNNEAMKQYTKNNKLTLEGAKKLYESTGAKCK